MGQSVSAEPSNSKHTDIIESTRNSQLREEVNSSPSSPVEKSEEKFVESSGVLEPAPKFISEVTSKHGSNSSKSIAKHSAESISINLRRPKPPTASSPISIQDLCVPPPVEPCPPQHRPSRPIPNVTPVSLVSKMAAESGKASTAAPVSSSSGIASSSDTVNASRRRSKNQEFVIAAIKAQQEKVAAEVARKAAEAEKVQSKVNGTAKVTKAGKAGKNAVAPKNALMAVKSNLAEQKATAAAGEPGVESGKKNVSNKADDRPSQQPTVPSSSSSSSSSSTAPTNPLLALSIHKYPLKKTSSSFKTISPYYNTPTQSFGVGTSTPKYLAGIVTRVGGSSWSTFFGNAPAAAASAAGPTIGLTAAASAPSIPPTSANVGGGSLGGVTAESTTSLFGNLTKAATPISFANLARQSQPGSLPSQIVSNVPLRLPTNGPLSANFASPITTPSLAFAVPSTSTSAPTSSTAPIPIPSGSSATLFNQYNKPIKVPTKKYRTSGVPLPLPSPLPMYPTAGEGPSSFASGSLGGNGFAIPGSQLVAAGFIASNTTVASDSDRMTFANGPSLSTSLSPVKKKPATGSLSKKKKRMSSSAPTTGFMAMSGASSASGGMNSTSAFSGNPFVFPISSAAATGSRDSPTQAPSYVFPFSTPSSVGAASSASGPGLAALGMGGLGIGGMFGGGGAVGGGMVGFGGQNGVGLSSPGFGTGFFGASALGGGGGMNFGAAAGAPLFTQNGGGRGEMPSALGTGASTGGAGLGSTVPVIEFDFVGKSSPARSPTRGGGMVNGARHDTGFPIFQGMPSPQQSSPSEPSPANGMGEAPTVSPAWEAYLSDEEDDTIDYGRISFTLKDVPDLLDDTEVEHIQRTNVDAKASTQTALPPRKKKANGKPPLHPNYPAPPPQPTTSHQQQQQPQPNNAKRAGAGISRRCLLIFTHGISFNYTQYIKPFSLFTDTHRPSTSPSLATLRQASGRHRYLGTPRVTAATGELGCFFCEFEHVWEGKMWRNRTREVEEVEQQVAAGGGERTGGGAGGQGGQTGATGTGGGGGGVGGKGGGKGGGKRK
ncbi:hypothetical protein BC829DRAFT_422809 [Chytridium lagenaria]|nr:hypothetical protein BC829DRAFT_422809 [Chytridium lagenaria]